MSEKNKNHLILYARMDNYDIWQSAFYDDDGRKDRVMFTYDKVPFNMLGTFKSFEFWDKDLIMTCVDFKKKFDKWPTAILTNEATYERWEEAVRSQLGDPHSENKNELPEFLPASSTRLDLSESDADEYWDNFDTDIPLDEITPEGVPIEFGEDFATPFFRLELLIDNNYEEGMFRLMFGEGPGTDEGEEIPDAERKTA